MSVSLCVRVRISTLGLIRPNELEGVVYETHENTEPRKRVRRIDLIGVGPAGNE